MNTEIIFKLLEIEELEEFELYHLKRKINGTYRLLPNLTLQVLDSNNDWDICSPLDFLDILNGSKQIQKIDKEVDKSYNKEVDKSYNKDKLVRYGNTIKLGETDIIEFTTNKI